MWFVVVQTDMCSLASYTNCAHSSSTRVQYTHKIIFASFFVLSRDSLGYDILGEPSPTPVNALLPAEKLQWKLSPDTVQDIAVATKNLNKYAYYILVHFVYIVCM